MNVAQMIPRKNQVALIRALRIICDERPEFSLLLIGRGPDAHALSELAKSLGLDGKAILQTERLPNTALASIYSKAFLTAMPSEYEIFGMTILESFACGTPVIGRRTGGMADVVEHGVNGWLHDDDRCEALSSIALQMCKDKDLCQEEFGRLQLGRSGPEVLRGLRAGCGRARGRPPIGLVVMCSRTAFQRRRAQHEPLGTGHKAETGKVGNPPTVGRVS